MVKDFENGIRIKVENLHNIYELVLIIFEKFPWKFPCTILTIFFNFRFTKGYNEILHPLQTEDILDLGKILQEGVLSYNLKASWCC